MNSQLLFAFLFLGVIGRPVFKVDGFTAGLPIYPLIHLTN
jgi:hypothetical protein